MKSPSTILNSIQMMKSNLKNDKQQLRIIKNNFTSLQRSVSVSKVQHVNQKYQMKQSFLQVYEPLKQIKDSDNILNKKQNIQNSFFNEYENKQNRKGSPFYKQSVSLVNMRKKYQKQTNQLKERLKQQYESEIKNYKTQFQQKIAQYLKKEEEQTKYVIVLEEQLNSSTKQVEQLKLNHLLQLKQLKQVNRKLQNEILTLQENIQKNQYFWKQKQFQNQRAFNGDLICVNTQSNQEITEKNIQSSYQQRSSKSIIRNYQNNQNYYSKQQLLELKINEFFEIVDHPQGSKHSDCCSTARMKYQKIVNKLLEQNSVLLSKIQRISHDNVQKKVKIQNVNFPQRIQNKQNKFYLPQSNYNSQRSQMNEVSQSRGRKSIVYKISNVLASSNVSNKNICSQASKVSKISIKNKKSIKYFRTQANQNYQNDQNVDLSNIKRNKISQIKQKQKSPISDFYSRIQVEQTVNFTKKQRNQVSEDEDDKHDRADQQTKLKTIKGFTSNQNNSVKQWYSHFKRM